MHAPEGVLQHLPVEQIECGTYQPRQHLDPQALDELAQSIRAQGLMQPIVVRQIAAQRYEIIAGERRWRASQLAGLERIPALIREASDTATMAMALIENIQRENLNPIEEATALQRFQREFKLTQQEIADLVGKSRVFVANLLRLLNLPDAVKALLIQGELEAGHARALLGLPRHRQLEAAQAVIEKSLTVRQTEALVRQWLQRENDAETPVLSGRARVVHTDIQRLEERLTERLGVAVEVRHRRQGRGELIIRYGSLDELQGVLAHIR